MVAFVALLVTAGAALGGLTVYRVVWPQQPPRDLVDETRDYLRARKAAPLSGPLAKLLSDPATFRVGTQAHPLLGKPAPEFELTDPYGKVHRFADLRARGPVVLVFYYGYHCPHCVSQLFDLNEEVGRFNELGTEVIAVSADPPGLTRKRYDRYGAFNFTVLSDPDKKVEQAYGVFTPAGNGEEEALDHGTFVIGQDGVVRWAQQGDTPFNGTRTLLYEAARLQGRLPESPAASQARP
jgi:peroxiredoxin